MDNNSVAITCFSEPITSLRNESAVLIQHYDHKHLDFRVDAEARFNPFNNRSAENLNCFRSFVNSLEPKHSWRESPPTFMERSSPWGAKNMAWSGSCRDVAMLLMAAG